MSPYEDSAGVTEKQPHDRKYLEIVTALNIAYWSDIRTYIIFYLLEFSEFWGQPTAILKMSHNPEIHPLWPVEKPH